MTKDDVIDMIMQLSDDGYIKDEVSLFGGKFKARFKTAKLTDTKKFVDVFDGMNARTAAKAEYYLNLYSLAAVLNEFNGKELPQDDIIERAKWIEDTIPVPVYKALIDEANKFHAKIEILNSEEVSDFF
jgi:hypothetical protein